MGNSATLMQEPCEYNVSRNFDGLGVMYPEKCCVGTLKQRLLRPMVCKVPDILPW